MVRALREICAADVGLELRAGVNRGRVFTGDIGSASRRRTPSWATPSTSRRV